MKELERVVIAVKIFIKKYRKPKKFEYASRSKLKIFIIWQVSEIHWFFFQTYMLVGTLESSDIKNSLETKELERVLIAVIFLSKNIEKQKSYPRFSKLDFFRLSVTIWGQIRHEVAENRELLYTIVPKGATLALRVLSSIIMPVYKQQNLFVWNCV